MLEKNDSSLNYYQDGPRDISKMMDDVYSQAITINQGFWDEADIDSRFKAGDQQVFSQVYSNFGPLPKKQFSFNRIRRVCNMITGHQRQNRKSTVTVPVEHNDDRASSQWTKLLFNVMKGADADEMISEAFEQGAVTTGMSLLNVWIDYSRDPESGDIKIDQVPYNAFLIDPYFRKKDLSDCNFVWRRQWLSKDALKAMIPEKYWDKIDHMKPGATNDGKFQYMAESYNYGMDSLFSYDEYWYKDMREATFLIDSEYGISREWTGSKEELESFLLYYPSIIQHKTKVPTVRLAVMVQGKQISDEPNPLGIDQYPFVPVLGYYDPNIAYFPLRVQGVVRGLRDSQYLYNRRKVIELDILESQVNSGFKYKPTSMIDPSDIYMTGQGKGIALKQEAQMTDIEQIMAPQIPPSMIQLSELLGQEIQSISGVNEELLGAATDDKAGVLAMLRQGAGLTTLQVLFDQLESSQKQLGRLTVDVIQKNFTLGKVARILNEAPVEEFKTKVWLNYDIRIEEGVNTSTQRKQSFIQLMRLKELGVPVPDKTLIDMVSIQNKETLVEDLEQQQQQAQAQQQEQMQSQMALLQAQIEELQSRAAASSGLAIERISRTEENKQLAVERRTQALENISDAQLNRAKTLKELEDLDISQIERLLNMARALKQELDHSAQAEMQSINPQQSF